MNERLRRTVGRTGRDRAGRGPQVLERLARFREAERVQDLGQDPRRPLEAVQLARVPALGLDPGGNLFVEQGLHGAGEG